MRVLLLLCSVYQDPVRVKSELELCRQAADVGEDIHVTFRLLTALRVGADTGTKANSEGGQYPGVTISRMKLKKLFVVAVHT